MGNGCCDHEGYNFSKGLKNSEIRRIDHIIRGIYWTIRKKR